MEVLREGRWSEKTRVLTEVGRGQWDEWYVGYLETLDYGEYARTWSCQAK